MFTTLDNSLILDIKKVMSIGKCFEKYVIREITLQQRGCFLSGENDIILCAVDLERH